MGYICKEGETCTEIPNDFLITILRNCKKRNKIYYLKGEDYRNADFMYEKFYTATMVGHNSGKLKTINTKNFKEL